jgi:sugar phosphate isomerase/epimerase
MKESETCGAQTRPTDYKICLCLNTLGKLDYESQIKMAAQAGWQAVGITVDTLESYLSMGKTIEEVKILLEKNNLCSVEIQSFGPWVCASGKDQIEILDRCRKFSRISKCLEGPILVFNTRCLGIFDSSLARENFKEICRIAAEDGTRIGLEFVPFSPINTIKKAWNLIKETDPPNCGIILDFFHYFKGGSLLADLEEVPIEKIFDVHVDDLKDMNPEESLSILSRNYRVFPGEGNFIFSDILKYLFERGYAGYYSLEVLNRDYSREDPLKLALRAKESVEHLLNDYAQKRL